MLRLLVLISVATVGLPAFGQGAWNRYKPARIDTVIAAHRQVVAGDRSDLPDSLKYQFWAVAQYDAMVVDVSYVGGIRPISPRTQQFLDYWLTSLQFDSSYVDLFEEEALFEEDGERYWLPVQVGPLSYMRDELAPGDRIAVYLTFAGAHAGRAGPATWVFTVNEYEDPE